jgi:tRNA(Ile)-lysidine synthase
LDYDKIKGSIVIRTRNKGDYLTVNSLNQKKTLKSYFIDEKVPQSERDGILLLAEESHIIWVIGARISNYYKVAQDTGRILCVTYTCNDKGEV